MKYLVIVIIVVAIIVGLKVFRAEAPTEEPVVDDTTVSGAVDISGESMVKEVAVTGSNFEFSLAEIRVKRGETVKVAFTSASGGHNWTLDEFNVGTKVLQAGESETVEFVADQTGEFEYYCSVGNHRAMGMVGKLMVEA